MKKYLLLVVCCFLLVGCGKSNGTTPKQETPAAEEKKNVVLTCAKDSDDPIHFTTEMLYYFENDKLVNLGVRYTYDLSSYNETQRKSFADSKLCETDSIKNTLGMTECKEALVGTNYIVDGYAQKLFEQSSGTISAIESSYVSGGWTCSKN